MSVSLPWDDFWDNFNRQDAKVKNMWYTEIYPSLKEFVVSKVAEEVFSNAPADVKKHIGYTSPSAPVIQQPRRMRYTNSAIDTEMMRKIKGML